MAFKRPTYLDDDDEDDDTDYLQMDNVDCGLICGLIATILFLIALGLSIALGIIVTNDNANNNGPTVYTLNKELHIDLQQKTISITGADNKERLKIYIGHTMDTNGHFEATLLNKFANISFTNGNLRTKLLIWEKLRHQSFVQYHVRWSSDHVTHLQDQIELAPNHWYGGAEVKEHRWPMELQSMPLQPYVTSDILQDNGKYPTYGGILEKYFLSSAKIAIKLPFESTLWVGINDDNDGLLKLHSQTVYSVYENVRPSKLLDLLHLNHTVTLDYSIIVGNHNTSLKDFHMAIMRELLLFRMPNDIVDEQMLRLPLWSTSSLMRQDITQDKLVSLANDIKNNGYDVCQLEIDRWQTHNGDLEFDPVKFPNITQMALQLENANITRITLWTHPFINLDSDIYINKKNRVEKIAVIRHDSSLNLVQWWDGVGTSIDSTDVLSRAWFITRHMLFQEKQLSMFSSSGFKFDAGEVGYLGRDFKFRGLLAMHPNGYSRDYQECVRKFTPIANTRGATGTHHLPLWRQIVNKNTTWGLDNGLHASLTVMLSASIVGYPFLMSGSIGGHITGNMYPDAHLFVRWAQANVFTPNMQFSIPPWDKQFTNVSIDNQTVNEITHAAYELRLSYADYIVKTAEQVNTTRMPMMRPLWFIEDSKEALEIDDEYLFGDCILVAPMIMNGTTRNVYLPKGTWLRQGNLNETHNGPKKLQVQVPYSELLYFTLDKCVI